MVHHRRSAPCCDDRPTYNVAMMRTLHIVLPQVPPSPGGGWRFLVSLDGTQVESEGVAALAAMPQADVVVAVVAPPAVSWHSVHIPPVASSRLRATLDGLLEDRLLDDPATCALALAPASATDGSRTVAVFERQWLTQNLQLLEDQGRMVARVVPLFWPAGESGVPRLLLTGTPDDPQCVLVDRLAVLQGTPASMAHCCAATGLASPALYSEPGMAATAGELWEAPATVVDAAQHLLASATSGWELAQFDLAISRRGRLLRRWGGWGRDFWAATAWRPARWGVLVLLLANLLGWNAWAWQLDNTVRAKREQVRTVFSQAFPKVKTIVDAPLQMERELATLRRASGGLAANDLEAMLSALAQVLPAGQAATSIDYSGGELVVGGLGLSPAAVAEFTTRLAGAGYTAKADGNQIRILAGGRP